MIALGNDVIDRTEIPRNGAKYYRRLQSYAFAPDELAQFRLKRDLAECLAIGWSIKEAAYKSVTKLIGRRIASPKDFHFELNSETTSFLTCSVRHNDLLLLTETTLTNAHVHTLSYHSDEMPEIVVGIGNSQTDYTSQSRDVRALALQSMTRADGISKNREGVPYFERAGEALVNELSLSHHGRWVAFVYQL